MSVLQGAESNISGKWLEEAIVLHLNSRGFRVVDYSADLDNGHLWDEFLAVRQVPYRNIYGCHSRSDFVLHLRGVRSVRVECRVQETNGSTDEKFPFMRDNAVQKMPEPEVIYVLHGDGARREAVAWFKAQASMVEAKRILVLTLSEFYAWLKDATKK